MLNVFVDAVTSLLQFPDQMLTPPAILDVASVIRKKKTMKSRRMRRRMRKTKKDNFSTLPGSFLRFGPV